VISLISSGLIAAVLTVLQKIDQGASTLNQTQLQTIPQAPGSSTRVTNSTSSERNRGDGASGQWIKTGVKASRVPGDGSFTCSEFLVAVSAPHIASQQT
jgi:hypothetical protein